MLLFALCLAIGVLLAQTFRVFVLAPATLLIIVVSIAGETAGTESLWIKLLVAGIAATALQAGYLIGIGPWINRPLLAEPT
jgi:hypothetical protein